jgi:transcriptional regulator with XRE-family HTH domain
LKTFGRIIAEARKALVISQKDLAARINKEDGEAISPQYLNDKVFVGSRKLQV